MILPTTLVDQIFFDQTNLDDKFDYAGIASFMLPTRIGRRLLSSIKTSIDGSVGLVQLNRPEALNALSCTLISELEVAFKELQGNPQIGCLLLMGNDKAFAGTLKIKSPYAPK